ncbi:MAG: ACP S-malonyltransferase [Deltaproteobacteria bacterium]|nr:ACP S-malonyltransferase [Deltaproteobacteria bacterium]
MSVAFIFPGQGSQDVGMGQALMAASPEARAALDEADAALGGGLHKMLAEGPVEVLKQTANTQPAILTVSVAAHRAFVQRAGKKLDGAPVAMAGHSLGEWSAMVATGAFTLTDAVRAVRQRGQFMQEAVPAGEGAMAAILGLEPKAVAEACAEVEKLSGRTVSCANFNSPEQTVIAGHADAVERTIALLKGRGAKRALPLPVSAPFHCALMAPVQPRLEAVLRGMFISTMAVPVWSNVSAAPNQDSAVAVRQLIEQVVAPVRWVETIEKLAASGVDTLVELGPGKVLAGLTRRIDKKLRTFSIEDEKSLDACVNEI